MIKPIDDRTPDAIREPESEGAVAAGGGGCPCICDPAEDKPSTTTSLQFPSGGGTSC